MEPPSVLHARIFLPPTSVRRSLTWLHSPWPTFSRASMSSAPSSDKAPPPPRRKRFLPSTPDHQPMEHGRLVVPGVNLFSLVSFWLETKDPKGGPAGQPRAQSLGSRSKSRK